MDATVVIIALLSIIVTLMVSLFAAFLAHTRACADWRDKLNVEHGRLMERTKVE